MASRTKSERIGELAMQAMDQIEESFGDEATVGTVCIVADLVVKNDDEEGMPFNPIIVVCSDPRRWVQLAILQQAVQNAEEADCQRELEAKGEPIDDDDDD